MVHTDLSNFWMIILNLVIKKYIILILIEIIINLFTFTQISLWLRINKVILLMTEKEKMLAGMVYSAIDKELLDELNAVKEIIHRYNALSPADNEGRLKILKGLLGDIKDD